MNTLNRTLGQWTRTLVLAFASTSPALVIANNNFADRVILSSTAPISVTGNNTGADTESGEFIPDGGGLCGASVWYQWSPPTDGWYTVHTVATDIANNMDTVLILGRGGSSASTTQIRGFNDESERRPEDYPPAIYPSETGPSRLVFYADHETNYTFAVCGFNLVDGPVTGPFEFRIEAVTPDFAVTSNSVSPTAVDVTSSAKSVTTILTVKTTAPFAGARLSLLNTTLSVGPSRSVAPANRISGSTTNGTYRLALSVPKGMPSGPAAVTIESPDGKVWTQPSNDSVRDDFIIAGSAAVVTVTGGSSSDFSGPVITAFSGLPATADVSSGAVPVTFTLTAADDLTGVATGTISLTDGVTSVDLADFSSLNLVSGNYVVNTAIPDSLATGSYDVAIVIRDTLGNESFYGPTDSPLPGDSTIAVTNVAGGFAAWAGTQDFGPGGEDGMLQDPNGDGTVNLLCYAFNLPPFLSPASVMAPGSGIAGLPSITTIGSGASLQLRIEFLRRKDAGNGLTYRPQFGSNLRAGAWAEATPEPNPDEIDANWERVIVLDPVTGAGPRFGRVVVEAAAP